MTICPKLRQGYRELDKFEHKMRTQFHCISFFLRFRCTTSIFRKQSLTVILHSVTSYCGYELNVTRSQILARQETHYCISHSFHKKIGFKSAVLIRITMEPCLTVTLLLWPFFVYAKGPYISYSQTCGRPVNTTKDHILKSKPV